MIEDDARTLLALRDVDTYYGDFHVLQSVSLTVRVGELVCLLGGNASGKSTTIKTILGIVRPRAGTVHFDGLDVTTESTSSRIKKGMAVVPENGRLFGPMSVVQNLKMGAYLRDDDYADDLDYVYELFPVLANRRTQSAATLSGGEQQMLAMGRALMAKPRLLLMDEPSMGFAPNLVEQSFEVIRRINREGVSVLLVEQNANMALSVADRGYVLATGRIILEDRADVLAEHDELKKAYLGR